MNTNSNSYTIIYASIMVVIVAFLFYILVLFFFQRRRHECQQECYDNKFWQL